MLADFAWASWNTLQLHWELMCIKRHGSHAKLNICPYACINGNCWWFLLLDTQLAQTYLHISTGKSLIKRQYRTVWLNAIAAFFQFIRLFDSVNARTELKVENAVTMRLSSFWSAHMTLLLRLTLLQFAMNDNQWIVLWFSSLMIRISIRNYMKSVLSWIMFNQSITGCLNGKILPEIVKKLLNIHWNGLLWNNSFRRTKIGLASPHFLAVSKVSTNIERCIACKASAWNDGGTFEGCVLTAQSSSLESLLCFTSCDVLCRHLFSSMYLMADSSAPFKRVLRCNKAHSIHSKRWQKLFGFLCFVVVDKTFFRFFFLSKWTKEDVKKWNRQRKQKECREREKEKRMPHKNETKNEHKWHYNMERRKKMRKERREGNLKNHKNLSQHKNWNFHLNRIQYT